MKTTLYTLSGISALGLLLSLIAHVAALRGYAGPLGEHTTALFVGIFIVWLPTILASNSLAKDVPRKDLWKATLRGCPAWMKYATGGFFGYALLNFFLAITAGRRQDSAGLASAQTVRAISGHAMAFYSAAWAVLYSAAKLWGQERPRRCSAGHTVGPLAKFCDQCGQPVREFTDAPRF